MNSKELEGRLKSLSYRIVNLCDALPKKKISKIIEDQLLRSAFSSAANYRASCKAISKNHLYLSSVLHSKKLMNLYSGLRE